MKGDVVIMPFPYSNLHSTKLRPALVLQVLPGEDLILALVTSSYSLSSEAIPLGPDDFIEGGLHRTSLVKPSRIFTSDRSLVISKAGRVSREKIDEIINLACEVLRR